MVRTLAEGGRSADHRRVRIELTPGSDENPKEAHRDPSKVPKARPTNPAGQFDVLKAASGVYKFLGTDGLGAGSMPPEGKLVKSTLGYFIRPGQHSMTKVDWQAFLDFADAHFGKPAVTGAAK